MATLDALAQWGNEPRRFSRIRSHTPSAAIGIAAAACGALGCNHLGAHFRADEPSRWRASVATWLLGLAVCQAAIAWRLWHAKNAEIRARRARVTGGDARILGRRLFMAIVLSYVLGLCCGENLDARYLFQASVAFWWTLTVWLLSAPHGVPAHSWTPRIGPLCRWLGRGLFATAATLAVAESSLRVAELLSGQRLPALSRARALKLHPGREIGGQVVNRFGYWDDEFETATHPGRFRVAVLGDGPTLAGPAGTNCLAQIERQVPGVDVYNFGLPRIGPREHAAQLAGDVARFHPDLVLTFFSAADDVIEQLPPAGAFDWRGLRIAQFGSPWLVPASLLAPVGIRDAVETHDYETFLSRQVSRLDVCHTPILAATNRQWKSALSGLDDLVRQCRRLGVPMALVVVPGDFQVRPIVCEALRRRAGYAPGQIDLELPQRRLTRFALEHEIPLLDLLPYLRRCDPPPYQRHRDQWTADGHELAGKVIGGWLQSRYGQAIAGR